MRLSAGVVLSVLVGCAAPPPPPVLCPLAEVRMPTALVFLGVERDVLLFGPLESCPGVEVERVTVRGPGGDQVEAPSSPLFGDSALVHGEFASVWATSVRAPADALGTWTIDVRWKSGGTSTRDVLVIPHTVLPMARRRYVDRMDQCDRGPYRTLNGVTLCQRVTDISAYAPDGSLLEHFHGDELAVRGDEVWSTSGDRLEHRSDVGGLLRFDGAIPTGPSTRIHAETQPGVAWRGLAQLPDGGTSRVLEARWSDAGLAPSFHEGVSDFPWRDSFLVYEPDGGVWATGSDTCFLDDACGQPSCPTVSSCIPRVPSGTGGGNSQFGSPGALWNIVGAFRVFGQLEVTALERPLHLGAPRVGLPLDVGAVPFDFNAGPGFERPRFFAGNTAVLPRLVAGEIQLTAFTTDRRALTLTDEWVITQGETPFSLLFAPPPP